MNPVNQPAERTVISCNPVEPIRKEQGSSPVSNCSASEKRIFFHVSLCNQPEEDFVSRDIVQPVRRIHAYDIYPNNEVTLTNLNRMFFVYFRKYFSDNLGKVNPTLPGQGPKTASFALTPYYSKKS
jgi:hypothetical protein